MEHTASFLSQLSRFNEQKISYLSEKDIPLKNKHHIELI
jgi:hypothetical protein